MIYMYIDENIKLFLLFIYISNVFLHLECINMKLANCPPSNKKIIDLLTFIISLTLLAL